MATCDTCGNEFDEMLHIEHNGESYQFDCFECAIAEMAPQCASCGTAVIGHGLGTGSQVFCCAHCAREAGVDGFVDRVG